LECGRFAPLLEPNGLVDARESNLNHSTLISPKSAAQRRTPKPSEFVGFLESDLPQDWRASVLECGRFAPLLEPNGLV